MDGRRPAVTRVHRTRPTGPLARRLTCETVAGTRSPGDVVLAESAIAQAGTVDTLSCSSRTRQPWRWRKQAGCHLCAGPL